MNQKNVTYFRDVLTTDELAILTDDELAENYRALLQERDAKQHRGYDLKLLEIEDCYFRREIQIRRKRKEAHEDWLSREREFDDASFVDEENLPNADFDNADYVRTHRLWNKTRRGFA